MGREGIFERNDGWAKELVVVVVSVAPAAVDWGRITFLARWLLLDRARTRNSSNKTILRDAQDDGKLWGYQQRDVVGYAVVCRLSGELASVDVGSDASTRHCSPEGRALVAQYIIS